jgi:hypothetical protein
MCKCVSVGYPPRIRGAAHKCGVRRECMGYMCFFMLCLRSFSRKKDNKDNKVTDNTGGLTARVIYSYIYFPPFT